MSESTMRPRCLPPDAVFTLADCSYATSRIVSREDEFLTRRLFDYVSKSRLWPKLVNKAATNNLRNFIVNGLLMPVACEFVRAQREGRLPDNIRLARVWRRYACQCSVTEKGSEVPDASQREIKSWLPENQSAPKWRRVTCSKCRQKFRVRDGSTLTKCFNCRYPGMRGQKGVGKAKNTPLKAA